MIAGETVTKAALALRSLMRWMLGVAAAGALVGAGGTVHASDQSLAGAVGAEAEGRALYASRCAGCHDNATDRTPSRELLARNPPSFVVSTLRTGAMAPMAEGLSLDQIAAIARYVSSVKDTGEVDPNLIWGPSAAEMPLDAPRCLKAAPRLDLTASQWNGWSVKPDNARYQPDPGLKAAAVPRLKLKWAFNYPGSKNGQATVVGDRLFVTSMSGAVYALNARTGCVYWRHAVEAATRSSVTVVKMPANSKARFALFVSDWTKSVVALDADTGAQLWKTKVDDSPGLQMTGAPTVYGQRLFVPISSGIEAFAQSDSWECCKFRGSIVTLDIVTGKVLWKTYTTSVEPKVFKTNRLGQPMWGPSGGAIWAAPTVDAARNLIYVGTSNSYTDVPYDGSDAVIAMDMATGAVRWKTQLLPGDNYINGCWERPGRPASANCPSPLGPDYAIGNSPILIKLKDGRERLVVGQKSSQVHALDPAADGKLVWQTRLSPGSALGGVEFGMAWDGHHIYAGVSDVIAGPKGKPGLYALNPENGALAWGAPSPIKPTCRWKSRWCHGAISQAVTAMPGVVFAGSYDGHFRAYSATDGRVIWDYDTGSAPIPVLGGRKAYGGVMDGAGPTIAGGRVYVHSGYAGRSSDSGKEDLKGSDGNVLIAFSVDGR